MKTTFTIILTLFTIAVFGQVKIGNITISEATAQKYFLDCYSHPDTIEGKTNTMGFPNDPQLKKISIGQVWKDKYTFMGWLVPRKPSERDFIKWSIKQNNH